MELKKSAKICKNENKKRNTYLVVLRLVYPRKIVAFCANCFCHNLKTNKVKYIKVYIFRKGISQGIYLNRFVAKNHIFEKSPKKGDFFGPKFFNKGKKYFWTKITKKLPKPSKYVYLGNVFSLFVLINYFEKFDQKS